MTAPQWTPASRGGIIPLHPLTFGQLFGRAFSALRHNPKVLLLFALGVQSVAYVIVIVGIVAAGFWAYSRLDSLRPSSPHFAEIMAGSVLVVGLVGILGGILAQAVSVLVQGIVAAEVAHAAVGEKMPLRVLWQRVRPVAWRLLGWSFLLLLVLVAVLVLVAGLIFLIAVQLPVLGVVTAILLSLGSIPLFFWLRTKLLLVPSAIVLERATIRSALVRSWRLTRGRFWPAFGVIILIALIMSAVSQAVGLPMSVLSGSLIAVFSPTGDPGAGAFITFAITLVLTQIITILIAVVQTVVDATASTLIYIDCRMRTDGLDLELLAYVDRRDAGATALGDPYAYDPSKAPPLRPAWGVPPAGAFAQQGYPPAPGYAPGGYAYPQAVDPTASPYGPPPGFAGAQQPRYPYGQPSGTGQPAPGAPGSPAAPEHAGRQAPSAPAPSAPAIPGFLSEAQAGPGFVAPSRGAAVPAAPSPTPVSSAPAAPAAPDPTAPAAPDPAASQAPTSSTDAPRPTERAPQLLDPFAAQNQAWSPSADEGTRDA